MHIINTILLLTASIEARQFDIAASYLAEDFTFEGLGLLQPSRRAYLNLLQALTIALPDWKLNLRNVRAIERGAKATIKVTGTHTGVFALPEMPVLKPTGKKIVMGEKPVEFSVNEDFVIHARLESGAGIPALFKQMGLQAH